MPSSLAEITPFAEELDRLQEVMAPVASYIVELSVRIYQARSPIARQALENQQHRLLNSLRPMRERQAQLLRLMGAPT